MSGRGRRGPLDLAALAFILYLLVRWVFAIGVRGAYGSTPMDEIFAALMIVPAAVGLFRYGRPIAIIPVAFLIYAMAGLLSVLLNDPGGVSQPMGALWDIALDTKPLIFLFAFLYLFMRSGRGEDSIAHATNALIVVALINSLFVWRDIVLGGGYGLTGIRLVARLGFYQPQGLMLHHLESCYVTMFGALAAMYRVKRYWTMPGLALVAYLALVFFLHLSAKEMFAFILCAILFIIGRKNKPPVWVLLLPVALLIAGGVVAFTPVGDVFAAQFQNYVIDNTDKQARTVLTSSSFEIADRYFPLGSGAGTFASPPSFQMGYSHLYYEFGINRVWGGSPENPNYLTDVFWPKLLAQAGYLGFAAFLVMLLAILFPLLRQYLRWRDAASWFCLSVNLSMLVMSIASTPYTQEFLTPLWAFASAYGLMLWYGQKGAFHRQGNSRGPLDRGRTA